MSCMVLVGGVVGCGKSTLLNFIEKNIKDLFENSALSVNNTKFSYILFDDLCTIKQQEQLMKTVRGWRNFRVDLLMATEHFICSTHPSDCCINGPLSERSYNLLQKLEDIHGSSSKETNVIVFIEDNFYYRSMRYEWLQIARRTNLGFCQIFLQCPLSTAIYRNSSRGYHIPEEKIKRMFSCLEYPDPVKYKWEKYSLNFDSSSELECSSLTDIIHLIEKASANPAEILINEDKIEAQKICSKNAIHQADKILRKLTSKKISEFKENVKNENDMKEVISSIIRIRQELLNNVKHGSLNLPEELLETIETSGVDSVQHEYEEYFVQVFDEEWEKKSATLNT